MERSLDLEITRRCNLRCDYCFVGWSRDWNTDLPRDVAESVLREGVGRFDLLHLTGGEPFARRDIFDLIDLGLSLGYPSVLINTNGTLLTEEHIRRLGAYAGRVHLSVSFDGPPALHDPIRGEGRFAQADQSLRALLAAGVPVTVMSVVTAPVLAVLHDFLRERMRSHPTLAGITLFPVGVGPTGSQKPGAPVVSLSPDDLRRLATVVTLAFHAGVPVTVGAYPLINPLLAAMGYPAERMYQCTAGRGRICVHADQSVSTCHPVKDPVYGRWSSGLFDRLGLAPAHEAIRTRDYDGCRSCEHQDACGHCRAFVTANGEGLLGNDRVCLDVVPGRRASFERTAARAEALVPAQSLVRKAPANDRVELVRRFFLAFTDGRFDDLVALAADDVVDLNPVLFQPRGPDGLRFKAEVWRAVKPQSRSQVVEVKPTPDGASARWTTLPGPGEPEGTYLGRFVVRAGRIALFEVTHVA